MKFTATLLILLVCYYAKAQIKQLNPVKDSVSQTDSVITDIKQDAQDHLPTIIVTDEEADEGSTATVSSILSAGRNPFLAAAAFNFSLVRFRLRGYENFGDALYLNGIEFTNIDNGFTPFSLWSGLNNVFKSQQISFGLEANDFAIGSIALNTNIDIRASAQRVQTQIGYASSNRNYRHRINFSHASGFNAKGWAYSLALTARYAGEGYIPGTYYKGGSYYAAIDKKIDEKNVLSLIGFGAPTENGRQTASVQEAMDIAGTNFYNPAWGYQNGKKRNANTATTFQPTFMLVHEYRPSNKSRWLNAFAYVFGKRELGGFDWYNAPDPRPDYYRYLPSYYNIDNPAQATTLKDIMEENPDLLQVNWNRLYEVNKGNIATVNNVNGEQGNSITGKRSLYILSNRVTHINRFIANTIYTTKLSTKLSFTGGGSFQRQVNHYYQKVKDLLGGDFWVNVNQFAERDFPNDPNSMQYDLDHPNQLKKQGDQYGYDYKMTLTKGAAWMQWALNLSHFDFFVGTELSATSFFRTGINKNGLFPIESFGNSKKSSFINLAGKGGITYKLNGRNYFFINGAYQTNPPFFENVFISQRTRNTVPEHLKSESVLTTEAGYKLNTPKMKIGITGYYTQTKNGYDLMSFYHDQYQNFVNYALSGIDKIYFGSELGIEYKLSSTLSVNGAASMGRYYYNSRQHAIVTVDNSAQVIAEQTLYLKNFRVPSTPQNAYSAGFFYRSPKYWYASFTGSYFNNMWLSVNPLRRSVEAIGGLDPTLPETNELVEQMIAQQKMDDAFVLDFFGGWSKKLPRSYMIAKKAIYLVFTIGINNILNNKNIRSGGFEQLRFDYETKDINKFPPKYNYAYGLNYFANITLRF